jgi:hypothetical protein
VSQTAICVGFYDSDSLNYGSQHQSRYTHRLTQTVPLRKVRLKSGSSVRVVNYTRTYKRFQLKSKLQLTGTRSAAAWPPATCVIAQQYSSATSYDCAFRPIKNKALLSKVVFHFLIFKNCFSLKLRSLNLHNSKSACAQSFLYSVT